MMERKKSQAGLKINDSRIDWTNPDSHYFFNPKHPSAQSLKELAKKLPLLKGHIYLFTSNMGKVCLLSKSAILHSAQVVSQNLQIQKSDNSLISLPLFHIAGLAILARSFCSRSQFEYGSTTWKASVFKKELEKKKISLCSLVPAQIYDLVQHRIKSPKTLRIVLVGGDHLSPWLYKKARTLGWPILISYGFTEASGQIACTEIHSLQKTHFPKMKILNHIEIQKKSSLIKIKSQSLLTAYFDREKKHLYDPKDSKARLELPDKVHLHKGFLSVKGRKGEEIKILGERVHLQKLSFFLEELSQNFPGEYYLTAVPEPRKGQQLVLVTNCFDLYKIENLVKKFNAKVLPFEKIQALYCVPEIEKSALFKVRQKQTQTLLSF